MSIINIQYSRTTTMQFFRHCRHGRMTAVRPVRVPSLTVDRGRLMNYTFAPAALNFVTGQRSLTIARARLIERRRDLMSLHTRAPKFIERRVRAGSYLLQTRVRCLNFENPRFSRVDNGHVACVLTFRLIRGRAKTKNIAYLKNDYSFDIRSCSGVNLDARA